jgi:hypothetical protein
MDRGFGISDGAGHALPQEQQHEDILQSIELEDGTGVTPQPRQHDETLSQSLATCVASLTHTPQPQQYNDVSRTLPPLPQKYNGTLPPQFPHDNANHALPPLPLPQVDGVPSPDWVISTTSNVCIAQHRAWFKSYTEFRTTVHLAGPGKVSAIGIGTVRVPVQLRSGLYSDLHIPDVLHVPSSEVNIFGIGISAHAKEISVLIGDDGWIKDRRTRMNIVLDDSKWPPCLKVDASNRGWNRSMLLKGRNRAREDGLHINAVWPTAERESHLRLLGHC